MSQALHKIDIITGVIKTEKTERVLGENSYCFSVTRCADKKSIAEVLGMLYGVKVLSINTVSTLKKIKVINKKFKIRKSSSSKHLTEKKAYVTFESAINLIGDAVVGDIS